MDQTAECGSDRRPDVFPAPNFAYELTAERGLPPQGDTIDLSNVVGLLNGSEPVTMSAIEEFTNAFAPYGLPATAIKPSYGMAEATLGVATTAPDAAARTVFLDRVQVAAARAVVVGPGTPGAVAYVSCGQPLPNLWAVIANSGSAEVPDGTVGEIWLHGNNIGRGYFGREDETERTFGNKLQSRLEYASHAEGAPDNGCWLATGDLGVYIDGELYLTGRIKDLVIIDGRNHYPHDIETTVSQASPAIRAGYVAAFSVPPAPRHTGRQLRRAACCHRRTRRGRRARGPGPDHGGRAGSSLARASGPGRRRPARRRRHHSPHHQRQTRPQCLPGGLPRRVVQPITDSLMNPGSSAMFVKIQVTTAHGGREEVSVNRVVVRSTFERPDESRGDLQVA